MKRVRTSSSSHSVKTSSNWSTTSSPATSGTEGSSPGVMTSPGPNAGSTPARSTDDFPLPDPPTTATKPRSRTRPTSSPATSSRPKNSSRSSRWNGSSPGYGHSVAGFGRADARGGDREDLLGLAHTAQPMGTEIDEGGAIRHPVTDEISRHARHQHLAAVAESPDPRSDVQRWTEVRLIPALRLSRVERGSHP